MGVLLVVFAIFLSSGCNWRNIISDILTLNFSLLHISKVRLLSNLTVLTFFDRVKRGQIPYLTCQQCLSDIRDLFRPPRPPPQNEPMTIASRSSSDPQRTKMEPNEPQPPIHSSIDLVLSSDINRRHSRRYTSSSNLSRTRSLSLYVYCPNGHIMKPFSEADGPTATSVKANASEEDVRSTEEVSDIENQITPPSCHGAKHHTTDGSQTVSSVEFHCSVCQYYLCDNCYTDELKRLNNIPAPRSPNRQSDSNSRSVSPRDIESRYAPTESGDTEDKNSTRGERQIETMSVQVEVDNFSVKSATDAASVHHSEYIQTTVSNSNIHAFSEDALSDRDIDSVSVNQFKYMPLQVNTAPRKLSVSGLTYSSMDSDSLRDDDSTSHFRVSNK